MTKAREEAETTPSQDNHKLPTKTQSTVPQNQAKVYWQELEREKWKTQLRERHHQVVETD
jgi:hypothetical protein